MDINQRLTEELNVKRWQVDAAVKLIDEGNTIPFISSLFSRQDAFLKNTGYMLSRLRLLRAYKELQAAGMKEKQSEQS